MGKSVIGFAKRFLVLAAAMVMLMAFAGCERQQVPSGTYTPGDNLTYITFDGNDVTLKMGQMTATGTFELDGTRLKIIYDNGDKDYVYDADADTITASNGDVLYNTGR